ncbi:hypothetical protein NK8_63450 (plasmid) [Caballeronia sp. NK8]|uniref:hypothetical protein n=1 Tax=Caballeronia sp. NK8 TaxID=140098 RepID=UPI001BB4D98E|nr:hypothetical protein [Caballeronia sp. NK8]BCQ28156.1 hypothetical protein NK8_63450 [Caballeronia sp. NK8]
MTTKDVIAQLLERGMAMQTFWGFYITVALGLVAFFGSAKRQKRLAFLMSLVFIGFAYVNFKGMVAVSTQRNFLYEVLGSIGPSTDPAPKALDLQVASGILELAKPDTPEHLQYFHIGADCAVLLAIWILTLWQSHEKK